MKRKVFLMLIVALLAVATIVVFAACNEGKTISELVNPDINDENVVTIKDVFDDNFSNLSLKSKFNEAFENILTKHFPEYAIIINDYIYSRTDRIFVLDVKYNEYNAERTGTIMIDAPKELYEVLENDLESYLYTYCNLTPTALISYDEQNLIIDKFNNAVIQIENTIDDKISLLKLDNITFEKEEVIFVTLSEIYDKNFSDVSFTEELKEAYFNNYLRRLTGTYKHQLFYNIDDVANKVTIWIYTITSPFVETVSDIVSRHIKKVSFDLPVNHKLLLENFKDAVFLIAEIDKNFKIVAEQQEQGEKLVQEAISIAKEKCVKDILQTSFKENIDFAFQSSVSTELAYQVAEKLLPGKDVVAAFCDKALARSFDDAPVSTNALKTYYSSGVDVFRYFSPSTGYIFGFDANIFYVENNQIYHYDARIVLPWSASYTDEQTRSNLVFERFLSGSPDGTDYYRYVISSEKTKVLCNADSYCGQSVLDTEILSNGEYIYIIVNDEIYIVNYIGDKSLRTLYIPEQIEGLPVVSLGLNRLKMDNPFTVIMPDTIRNIDFFRSSNIEKIVISNNTNTIGSNAFNGCSNLKEIVFGSNIMNIENNSFGGCSALESIAVAEDNLCFKSIDNCLIDIENKKIILGCKNSVIPSDGSIAAIGDNAFSSCTSLTSINIPDGIISIGEDAFWGCTSLTSVTIPDSVTSIGDSAFRGCTSLTSVIIGNSVTSIGDGAFRECVSLKSISLPNSIIDIGSDIFWGCSELSEIILSNNNTAIWGDKLDDTKWFTTQSDGIIYLGTLLYSYKGELTNGDIVINSSINEIAEGAFSGCASLTSVVIPESVTMIGERAFSGCPALETITVDSGNSVYHSAGNCIIETATKTLVHGCKNSVIPDDGSVTSIGDYAFYSCTSLTSVTIPDSVTSIGDDAFSGCSSLTSVTIPDSVTSIGSSAFRGCTSLTSVTIPDSVTSIGDGVFYNCTSLTSATIGSGITSMGWKVFGNCKSLVDIYYTSDIVSWININFEEYDSTPLYYGADLYINGKLLTNLIIPDGVTSIGDYSFVGCTSLISVTIGNSVTSIGEYAFYKCTSLTSVTIGDSVTSIGSHAFSGCDSLTSVTIGDSVTSIGDGAFYMCESLTSVTIPDSVTSIGERAFMNCDTLTTVSIGEGIISIDHKAFDCDSLRIINFSGTKNEWLAIKKGYFSHNNLQFTGVVCSNGKLDLY